MTNRHLFDRIQATRVYKVVTFVTLNFFHCLQQFLIAANMFYMILRLIFNFTDKRRKHPLGSSLKLIFAHCRQSARQELLHILNLLRTS
jgi:hypothetical protein